MKKWMVHNDYEPLGVYNAFTKEEALNRFIEDADKHNVKFDNKNINAIVIKHD